MQGGHAKIKDWKKKLEKRSASSLSTMEDGVKSDFSDCEDVADRGSKPIKERCNVGSSQPPIEDMSFAECRDDDSESEPPTRTDLTGFLEAMVEQAKQDGVYDSLDGFTDGVKELPLDDSEKSKDHHPDHSDKLEDNLPKKVTDPTNETFESSCGSSFSKTTSTSTLNSSRSATPGVFDPLCDLLTKTSLQASDQKSSMRVEIPKAYKFSISTEPKCHYDQVTYTTTKQGPNADCLLAASEGELILASNPTKSSRKVLCMQQTWTSIALL